MIRAQGEPRSGGIRGILFDFGNVIARFDNRRILEGLAPLCGKSPEEMGRLGLQSSSITWEYEAGALSSEQFLEAVSRLCGRSIPAERFVPVFTDIFTPIAGTCELIRRLKPRYQLGLVSNTNPWHFEHGIRPTEVFPLFDAVSLSFQVKAMKPDPRIFQDVLAKLGLPAAACAFIDDLPENVEGARSLGLRAIQYRGHEELLRDLGNLGIPV